jgi:hypothetical protein
MSSDKKLLYIKSGTLGTTKLIEAVMERILRGDINMVVVASKSGKTAIQLAAVVKGTVGVICVSEFTYDDEIKKKMKKLKIVPVEEVNLPFQDYRDMSRALNIFGSGVKAALEVAAVSAEKELNEGNIIAVAGSGPGLDTALVVKTSKIEDLSNPDPKKRMSVLEIIAISKRGC